MRGGMASSATRRRFSRVPVMNAVISGASSVTLLTGFSAGQQLRDALRHRWRRLRRPLARHGGLREHHRHGLARLVAAARDQHDGVAIDRELTGTFDAGALRVADVVQPGDELGLVDALARLQGEGPREDPRHGAIALAVQARVDDAPVRHVQIRDRAEQGHAPSRRGRSGSAGARAPASDGHDRRASRTRRPLLLFFFKSSGPSGGPSRAGARRAADPPGPVRSG